MDKNKIIKKVFNNTSHVWDKDPMFNLAFLKIEQQYFRNVLKRQGYIFLRDIYNALGFIITKESCTMGWYYGSEEDIPNTIFAIEQILDRDNEFIITFECYPILDYLTSEEDLAG